MSSDIAVEVSALAINVTIPEPLRWTDTRRGEEFLLTSADQAVCGGGGFWPRKAPRVHIAGPRLPAPVSAG